MNAFSTLPLSIFHWIVALLPTFISSRIYSTLFSLSLGAVVHISKPIKKNKIFLTSKNLDTSTFCANEKIPPNAHTYVVIHGVSVTGNEDPRIVNLARAIAISNPQNVAIIPWIPQLAECRIQDDVVGMIREVLEAVAADSALCPSGKLSVSSPCISGGFTLCALSEFSFVNSVLCIGPHSSVYNTLLHALERKGKDDSRYGICSVLSSFWYPPSKTMSSILAAYCADDHKVNLGMESNELAPLLEQYPEEANIYKRLFEDDAFLEEKLKGVYYQNEAQLVAMSPSTLISSIRPERLVLFHAAQDDIVPPKESIVLKEAFMQQPNTQVKCMVTSLLNHGDQKGLSLADMREILRMIDCFSAFFLPPTVPAESKKVN